MKIEVEVPDFTTAMDKQVYKQYLKQKRFTDNEISILIPAQAS